MKPFKSFVNKFNRNKQSKLYFYEIEKVDINLLDHLLSSSVTEGDVFGIEFHLTKGEIKPFLFTTPSMRLAKQEVKIEINPDLNYQLVRARHNTFFPIFTNRGKLLPDFLKQISNMMREKEEIVIQTKFHKRQGSWRITATNQLEDYMHGIDNPTSSNLIRTAQNIAFEKEATRDINEDKFNALERKIREDNFRFEMIVGTFAETDEREDFLVEAIRTIISKFDYMNEFEMEELSTVAEFHSTTFHQYEKQYLSLSEIYCLVSQERMEGLPDIPDTQPILPSDDVATETISPPTQPTVDTKTVIEAHKAIDLLPFEKVENQQLDGEIPKRILNSVNRVGASKDKQLKFEEQIQGSTLVRCTFEMPKGINLTDITKREKDLKAALGTENLTITQGDKPNTVAFFIPNEKRSVVYLKKMLKDPKFAEFAKRSILPFIVGEDEVGNPLYADFAKMPHVLDAGATGGGKSVWVSQLILTLILIKKPEELMIYIVDPKMVDFQCFKGFPQVKDVITDIKKSYDFLFSLTKQMDKRYEKMAQKGHRNVLAYNSKEPDKIPYLLCVVDEYNDLVTQFPDIEKSIERLGQKARAAGIHLLLATQRPDRDVISGVVKTNLPSVVCFKLKNNNEYKTVFGKGQPYKLLGNGHGVMSLEGQMKEYIQFQSACVHPNPNVEVETIEKVKAYLNGQISVEDTVDIEPVEIEEVEEVVEESDLDKLRRIIANTGETRVSQLQKEIGIRMNTVQDLMQQLVDEGWLFKHAARSKGYEIVADQNELNKWRDEPIVESKGSDTVNDENVVKHTPPHYTHEELMEKINEALDNHDEESFIKWSKMLKDIKDNDV